MGDQVKEPSKAAPKKAPSGKMTRDMCLELGLDPVPYGFKAK
jgi:hypothetical protein